MNLTELNQFNPTPESFPSDSSDTFWAFEGYPNALTNGYILDLDILPKDRGLLELALTTYPKIHLQSIMHVLEETHVNLIPDTKEAQIVHGLLVYISKHPLTHALFGMQVRHWNYFRWRYPKYLFFQGKCEHSDIVVKNDNRIVGFIYISNN